MNLNKISKDFQHGQEFFLRCLPVAPNKFRPFSRNGKDTFEHPKNLILERIVDLSAELKIFAKADKLILKVINNWLELQILVNCLSDSHLDGTTNAQFSGVRK